MTRSTLRFIRFFSPAIILVVLSYAIAKVVGYRSEDVPISVNDLGYNLGYLIIAAIYQYLPFTRWAHALFRADIDRRIRRRLVQISGMPDDPDKFSWKRVQNVFYALIDNDKSLEKRSEDVMFNGVMMTTFADLTSISAFFAIACGIAWYFGIPAGRAAVLLICLTAVSLLMQYLSMRRHVLLGTYQLDYIEQQLKAEVVTKMTLLNA